MNLALRWWHIWLVPLVGWKRRHLLVEKREIWSGR